MENGITVTIASTAVLIPFIAIAAVVLFLIIGLFFVYSRKKTQTLPSEQNPPSAVETAPEKETVEQ